MNDTFQCGDPGSLVAYLYDECEPGERELIATHITRCAACAREIETLGATRQALSAWAPPDAALGFQITRAAAAPAANEPARVLVPKIAWWRAPLPAWAQAAAAVVIFATGVSVGVGRNMTAGQTSREAVANPSATTTVASTTGVSRDELAQLEQRLRSEMSQMRTVSSAPAPARSGDAMMAEVRALIDESNAQQNREITLRLVDLESDFELRNRRMAESFGQSFGQLQGAVRTEVGQQRRALDGLIRNVSDQR